MILSLRSPWAGPLLRLINAARLFPQGPSRELPFRHRTAACVRELQLHRLYVYAAEFTRQTVSCYWYTVVVTLSVMEKINSSGTEDGERLIMELMITSHSHEFTQIMQMKSYYELCSVYTLSIHCSDHFQWHIHGKFSTTISLLARRHRDAEGLILYRCFLFLLFSTPNIWGHWTDLNQTWHTFTAIWKIWS